MKFLNLTLIMGIFVIFATPAKAQQADAKAKAKKAFNQGMAAMEKRDFK